MAILPSVSVRSSFKPPFSNDFPLRVPAEAISSAVNDITCALATEHKKTIVKKVNNFLITLVF